MARRIGESLAFTETEEDCTVVRTQIIRVHGYIHNIC